MFAEDRMMEALLKTCVKFGPIAYKNPENYEARANLMWASQLAIITPVMMKYILNEDTVDKFVNYGTAVFDIDKSKPKMDIANEAIEKTKELFMEMGLTMTLRDVGIMNYHYKIISLLSC